MSCVTQCIFFPGAIKEGKFMTGIGDVPDAAAAVVYDQHAAAFRDADAAGTAQN